MRLTAALGETLGPPFFVKMAHCRKSAREAISFLSFVWFYNFVVRMALARRFCSFIRNFFFFRKLKKEPYAAHAENGTRGEPYHRGNLRECPKMSENGTPSVPRRRHVRGIYEPRATIRPSQCRLCFGAGCGMVYGFDEAPRTNQAGYVPADWFILSGDGVETMSPQNKRRLNTIGQTRRDQIWNALCDAFSPGFHSREAVDLIAAEMKVARKTAELWFNALVTFWLDGENSDLVRVRQGYYSWERR